MIKKFTLVITITILLLNINCGQKARIRNPITLFQKEKIFTYSVIHSKNLQIYSNYFVYDQEIINLCNDQLKSNLYIKLKYCPQCLNKELIHIIFKTSVVTSYKCLNFLNTCYFIFSFIPSFLFSTTENLNVNAEVYIKGKHFKTYNYSLQFNIKDIKSKEKDDNFNSFRNSSKYINTLKTNLTNCLLDLFEDMKNDKLMELYSGIKKYEKKKEIYVRTEWGISNVFQDNGDGTITDKKSGLTWLKKSFSKKMSWDDAIKFAKKLFYLKHFDWRIPSLSELTTLENDSYNLNNNLIWLNKYGFNIQNSEYWTSTTSDNNYKKAWTVGYGNGPDAIKDKSNEYYIILVRGKQNNLK